MFFLTPRYIKEAKQYLQASKKILAYKRDILVPARVTEIEASIEELRAAMRQRDREEVAKRMRQLDELIGKSVPPVKNPGLRENIQVLVVAIVFAAGVKAFFLQPFRIPTGSMQPTLYGIVGVPTENPKPNLLVRAFDLIVRGRHHLDLRAKEEDVVVALEEKTYLNFFTFTKIVCRRHSYTLFAPRDPLLRYFRVLPGREYAAGEVIARGYVNTGDQIFVNKVAYNFIKPKLGDVFVFKTTGIREIEAGLDPAMGSQHYIKRLAGIPGDTLRIDPPNLLINGRPPEQPMIERVMSRKDGYQGYSNGGVSGPPFRYLGSPSATFTIPHRSYFALGDNSYHSRDSRDWGVVPERNVAGQGFFVYWPFSSRWGFIR